MWCGGESAGQTEARRGYVDRRSRMVLYHSEAWSSEQLQAGIVRNTAGIILIVRCHSMVSWYDREREAVEA